MYLGLIENNSSLILHISNNKKDIIFKYKEKLIKIDRNRKNGYLVCEEECNLEIYKVTEDINEAIIKIDKNNELSLLLIEEMSVEVESKIKSNEHHLNYIKLDNTNFISKKLNKKDYKYLSMDKLIDDNLIKVKKITLPKSVLSSKLKMDFHEKLETLCSLDNINDFFYDKRETEIKTAAESNKNIKFGSGYMIIENSNGEEIIPFKNISNMSSLKIKNGLIIKKDEELKFNVISTIGLIIYINNKEIEITIFPDLYTKIRKKFISKIKCF